MATYNEDNTFNYDQAREEQEARDAQEAEEARQNDEEVGMRTNAETNKFVFEEFNRQAEERDAANAKAYDNNYDTTTRGPLEPASDVKLDANKVRKQTLKATQLIRAVFNINFERGSNKKSSRYKFFDSFSASDKEIGLGYWNNDVVIRKMANGKYEVDFESDVGKIFKRALDEAFLDFNLSYEKIVLKQANLENVVSLNEYIDVNDATSEVQTNAKESIELRYVKTLNNMENTLASLKKSNVTETSFTNINAELLNASRSVEDVGDVISDADLEKIRKEEFAKFIQEQERLINNTSKIGQLNTRLNNAETALDNTAVFNLQEEVQPEDVLEEEEPTVQEYVEAQLGTNVQEATKGRIKYLVKKFSIRKMQNKLKKLKLRRGKIISDDELAAVKSLLDEPTFDADKIETREKAIDVKEYLIAERKRLKKYVGVKELFDAKLEAINAKFDIAPETELGMYEMNLSVQKSLKLRLGRLLETLKKYTTPGLVFSIVAGTLSISFSVAGYVSSTAKALKRAVEAGVKKTYEVAKNIYNVVNNSGLPNFVKTAASGLFNLTSAIFKFALWGIPAAFNAFTYLVEMIWPLVATIFGLIVWVIFSTINKRENNNV